MNAIRRGLAACVLTMMIAPSGVFAFNPVLDTHIDKELGRHEDRQLPAEAIRPPRERYGLPNGTPKLTKLPERSLTSLPKPAQLPRLVRLRHCEGFNVSVSTCSNGNVVINVPTGLRGAQRRAAVRQALRQTKLAGVPDLVAVTAERS